MHHVQTVQERRKQLQEQEQEQEQEQKQKQKQEPVQGQEWVLVVPEAMRPSPASLATASARGAQGWDTARAVRNATDERRWGER